MPYFLKTADGVNGPINDAIIKIGLKNKKIAASTELSTSQTGPWLPITEVFPDALPEVDFKFDLDDLGLLTRQPTPVGGNLTYSVPVNRPRRKVNRNRISKAKQRKNEKDNNQKYLLIGGVGVSVLCALVAVPLFLAVIINSVPETKADISQNSARKQSQNATDVQNKINSFNDDRRAFATGF